MAEPVRSSDPSLTLDAFLSDRQRVWGGFTGAFVKGGAAIIVLLILLTVFLV
jgi:hypothetical protein